MKKNRCSESATAINQQSRSVSGIKKGKRIDGIISNHKEFIILLISLYKSGAMGENIKTKQACLARFIVEKDILGHIPKGEYKPLSNSTIKTYISTLWNENALEETATGKRQKKDTVR